MTDFLLPNSAWYSDFLVSPLFAISLTLICFQLSQVLYLRSQRFPLLHPTIVCAAVIALLIKQLDISYQQYFSDSYILTLLLGPTTVALAIPLYQNAKYIRQLFAPIAITLVFGASFAALSAVGLAYAMGASTETLLSLSTKSLTTPIAMTVTEIIGGNTALAAGGVMVTAVTGLCFGPLLLRWLHIDDDRIWGFCLGISAHGTATVLAFERSSKAGAFASLALCLTGSFSAIVIPIVVSLLK
ncbi:LrgB family protein [Dasania marina]|uniref:LrgB family protein n=1 Tax=Dasania marina TaxID=471499 RepID=UPI0030D7C01C|tara:strand:+ start:57955 stop:58683 length:729 start_codon:yes stop_codon:yes gene_type:complete